MYLDSEFSRLKLGHVEASKCDIAFKVWALDQTNPYLNYSSLEVNCLILEWLNFLISETGIINLLAEMGALH